VSSVVSAPGAPPSRPNRTAPLARLRGRGLTGGFLSGVLGAVALLLVAFLGAGGNGLASNTWVQVGLVLLAAATAIAVVLVGARSRAGGAAAVLLFALLAALTYASIAWSVQPASSWLEANRTLSYLAAFATALMLARLAPGRWPALVGAVATAATVICAYSLLVKVFPGSLDPNDPFGRLRAPFDYWNAVGLMAAMGIPACLWAGARPDGAPWLRALSVPAIAILVPALILAYSRGALIVAIIGAAIWFALAPLRLRSALILALGVAGGAAISAWALATRGISADQIASATRTNAGHTFGLVLLVALSLSTAAGLAAGYGMDRLSLSPRLHRRIGAGLIGLAAMIPVGGVVALTASSRGLTGEMSHIWNTLTNPNGIVSSTQPGRLVQLSNSRPHYWSLGLTVGEHHLLAGTGAGSFLTAQTAFPASGIWDPRHNHAGHAHSYLIETFADLGLIGITVSLALLLAWALATGRTFGRAWPRRGARAARPPPSEDSSAERTGLIALLAIVVAFGLHSLIDWTWFIPGDAVTALVCAGWLAGRGTLGEPASRLPRRRVLSRNPAAAISAASIVVAVLLAVWVIAQPLRSADSYSSAITAGVNGNAAAAVSDARSAAVEDPVSIDPLFLLAQIYTSLGNPAAARRELRDAVTRQPSNPRTWQQLGCHDLGTHRTGPALGELHHALLLEPSQTQIQSNPTAFCGTLTGSGG
jgi:hypothetical protein